MGASRATRAKRPFTLLFVYYLLGWRENTRTQRVNIDESYKKQRKVCGAFQYKSCFKNEWRKNGHLYLVFLDCHIALDVMRGAKN